MTEVRRNSRGEVLGDRIFDPRSYDERQIEGYLRESETVHQIIRRRFKAGTSIASLSRSFGRWVVMQAIREGLR